MKQTNAAPYHYIIQLLYGSVISKTLSLIGELGIADIINDDELHISEIADKAKINESVIYRLLRALSSLGIFEEVHCKTFKNTDYSSTFLQSNPKSLKDMLIWCNTDINFRAINSLQRSLNNGESSFKLTYGEDIFSYFSHHEEDLLKFNKAMTSLTQLTLENIIKSYDFSNVKTIVDIGGGLGSFLQAIIKKNSHLNGILFDTKEVINHFNSLPNYACKDKITTISGNFLEFIPENYDLYVMKHVSHNWSDDKLITICNNLQQAMSNSSKLLIIDRIVNGSSDFAKWLDIVMLTLTPEGKERTIDEFSVILGSANLKISAVIETNEQEKIIEVTKL